MLNLVNEAALFAAHHKLTNLTIVVDHNKMQGLGFCDDVLSLRPFSKKWESFGWAVADIDGHDHQVLEQALKSQEHLSAPLCVIAHTVKGKGVSFMENQLLWHYRDPQEEHYTRAISDLENNMNGSIR